MSGGITVKDYLSNIKAVLPQQRDTVWIGTVNADGSPRLSARVVLGTEANRVFLCSLAGPSHLEANVARTNRGSLCAANAAERKGAQLKGTFTLHTSGPIFDGYSATATRLGFHRPTSILEFSPYLEFSVAPASDSYNPRIA